MSSHKSLSTVLAFGTFDLLHPGHRNFLRNASKLGKKLVVVVARDRNVWKLKNKRPTQGERARLRAVRKLSFVSRATLGQREFNHRYNLVQKLKPDIIALGYDQLTRTSSLAKDLRKLGQAVKIVRLKPFHPERYKSSLLRARLAKG
jgi:FAD synthetase